MRARFLLASLRALAALLVVSVSSASNAKGQAFLDGNKGAAGVVVLPSGLQYKVLKAATNQSAPRPSAGTPCQCHYEGRLLDGTVFDSSRKRGSPTTFAPSQALQLMRAGDRWELYIPSELAYGSRGAGGKIGADEVLIFDLELLSLNTGGVGPVMAVMSTPVLGPLAPWHLVLLALLAYRFMGGGGGGRKVAASHILVKEEEVCEKLKAELADKAGDAEAQRIQ
ncbi:hypothetical protein EMIHUDRAFT_456798 [Emiliania huxleyi CCMP1516]|uniref:peptidylprolyl isomerase n=2 Tax=Emiliania huxleyi TaxID=2903 RepID=A0A0D3K122_EMIH1|nr:hypothetical protein EMIHUDRAFT_456798 [Emiliania huxleyi CCMP1516]EOD29457.1 hypothetical protein EMIHUDRAFT_456798 [Emiliania huxleyi CCMP1516]|eukprot:XP_005781886.1 hypothetical protein EMIHUDRAFT_456798 [Emiliania huxleyi CCMP1516]